MQTINQFCPNSGKSVTPEGITEFRGYQVGTPIAAMYSRVIPSSPPKRATIFSS